LCTGKRSVSCHVVLVGNPNVSLPLLLSREKALHITVIKKYFDLHYKPYQLFNVDETGIPLNPKPLKMIFGPGAKNPVSICIGTKSQITIVV